MHLRGATCAPALIALGPALSPGFHDHDALALDTSNARAFASKYHDASSTSFNSESRSNVAPIAPQTGVYPPGNARPVKPNRRARAERPGRHLPQGPKAQESLTKTLGVMKRLSSFGPTILRYSFGVAGQLKRGVCRYARSSGDLEIKDV